MANSWIEICNLALIALGSNTITALENPGNGLLCENVLRGAVDEVLVEHEFACAYKRLAINPLAAAPDGVTWAYQYQLPIDFLAIRGVDPDSPYERQANVLLSNEAELTLLYTYQVEDPRLLDQHVARTIAAKIALILAPKIVQSNSLTQYIEGQYERTLLKARWVEHGSAQDEDVDLLSDRTLPNKLEEIH